MSKRIFFFSLALFLIFSGLLLWQGYWGWGFFSTKKTEIKTEDQSVESVKETVSENSASKETAKKLEKIVEGDLAGAVFLKKEKKLVFYSNQNFIKADLNGQNRQSVGAHPFNQVKKISWSLNNDKATIQDQTGYFLFDLEKEEIKPFPVSTGLLEWGFLNNQLVYEYFDQKKNRRILDTSFDLSGGNWEEIGEIPYAGAVLLVNPMRNQGLIFPHPGQKAVGDALKVNFSEKRVEKFLPYFKGMDFLFSPSGKKVLESYVKGDGRISLGVLDWETGAFQDLNFPTSVKKCVWKKSETEVICAALLSSEKVNLPEDWENKNGLFYDLFWKINLQNGKQTRLLEPSESGATDASGLFFDETQTRLFFIDRLSGGLFRLNLPDEEAEPKN